MPLVPLSTDSQFGFVLPDGTTQSHRLSTGRTINLWDNLIERGADPASNTDASSVLQALIDAVPVSGTAGVPAHTIYVPGHFRLDSQINVYQKAIRFVGRGVGNPSNFASGPGEGSGFRYTGGAAGNMFNVRDSMWVSFSDLYFQGNITNVPTALIYFENAGGSIGTNALLFMDRCQFGRLPWTNPGTNGTAATYGVRFGGTDGNNDQFRIRDCVFDTVATGLSMDNPNSVWGLIDNTLFDGCATQGLNTSASVTILNGLFNNNAIDMKIGSSARVQVFGYWSELSLQCAQITNVATLGIWGGLVTNNASMVTNTFDHQMCAANTGSLYLSGLRFNPFGLTHRKIKVRGTAAGVGRGAVTILDCPGFDFADLDIANVASGDPIDVNIVSNGMNIQRALASSQTLTLVGEFSGSGTPEGAITAEIGSTYKRINGGAGTSFYVKESGTGNTGWVAK